MRRVLWSPTLFLVMLLQVALAAPGLAAGHGSQEGGPYRDDQAPGPADGPGMWANLWNYPDGDLAQYCIRLRQSGIRNLFIQTSRSNTPAIRHPDKLGPLLDACHRHGIRVIAWSFAELEDPIADAEKMVEAALFTSPAGNRVDGIAPNLEKNLESWRIEKYSRHIRERLGRNYPMMAVVYSPLNKCVEVRRIRWNLLADYYDCIAPMVYWNSKYEKLEPYSYTAETIRKIRQLSGRPDIEIHAVGDGMGTNGDAIREFMRACRDLEATGFSLYPNQQPTPEQMQALACAPDYLAPNGRFRLAAFREYMKGGYLDRPPMKDPCQPVSRGDFYRLVVCQMCPALVTDSHRFRVTAAECRESSREDAYGILVGHALVPDITDSGPIEQILGASIGQDEALALLSAVVDPERRPGSRRKVKGNLRMDRWLIPPAVAEQSGAKNTSAFRALNYLDAAQMVLQASSALR